ncbi:MAG: zinc ABC transporter substrate-binding protein [Firmicutes bacterium]|nr:zinc ABC transporter substrate-binding protein [Bacillota bacterium]
MKKTLSILVLLLTLFSSTGCLKKDDLDGAKIYTTVYPITYIVETLYGENSQISSIYPNGSDVTNYKLNNKQIDEYSKANIFVYNGLSQEKEIAKNFLNKNKDLKILDVAYGLKYKNGIEELWLSPANYLMLASTTKNNLIDIIENKYLVETIEKNYNVLEEQLSIMDAELRTIASSSNKNSNELIVSSNVFKFLENYGFKVISLEDEENLSTNNLATIKGNFKSKKYTSIFVRSDEEKSDLVKDLIDNYDVKVIEVNTMNTLTDENVNNKETYFSIMENFLENIRNVTLG